MASLTLTALEGLPLITPGDDLAAMLIDGLERAALRRSHAARWGKDPRVVELVLRNTNRVVRMDRGVLIVETGPGWICANAGLDVSNTIAEERAILLPVDADRSAAALREELMRRCGCEVAVIVSDTFGRPWREGLTEICLGIAGMEALLDLRGTRDLGGRELAHTVVAVADELAGAAGLLMEKASAVPAVLVRGYRYRPAAGSAKALIRAAEADLFR